MATADHPVWVVGSGWRTLADVRPGSSLYSQDGTVLLRSLDFVGLPDSGPGTTVYNLELADQHSYLVGAALGAGTSDAFAWLWVHNSCWALSLVFEEINLQWKSGLLTAPEALATLRNRSQALISATRKRVSPWGAKVSRVYAGSSQNLRNRMMRLFKLKDLLANNEALKAFFAKHQAHHLLPVDVVTNNKNIRDFLDELTFDLDHPMNGAFLPNEVVQPKVGAPASPHYTNHVEYSNAIRLKLEEMAAEFKTAKTDAINSGGSIDEVVEIYRQRIVDVQHQIRKQTQTGKIPVLNSSIKGEVETKWKAALRDL